MKPDMIGLLVGVGVCLLVMKVLPEKVAEDRWVSIWITIFFITAGPAIADSIHAEAVTRDTAEMMIISVVCLGLAAVGIRRMGVR